MSTTDTFQADKINTLIVNWLRDYATNAKVKGFVVGISGGIDSALTSTLCAQTGMPTLCVEMPIHQAPNQVSRGKEHIEQLKKRFPNVSSVAADLTPVFEGFKTQVPASENEALLHLTLANTRARLRMTTLYYFAGLHSALVAGTGNKVEDFGVGFFTKYGDGGVDISPIADLLKSEVRKLSAYLQVPESILVAKPTDGLFTDAAQESDRSDEEQLGATYDELEIAMQALADGKTEKDFEGREKEVFRIFSRLNITNQHKMTKIPVFLVPNELK
ncbi:putative NH(3)-dependent NAD+ synthetase NadE [Flavobacterium enshiense DK69]|uniref:NH(3)-dependent NAD(+) synthetase n=1 Tax=Flavobacterium enshiense DK69 TaxID=1107311 RepID=V6SA34_9FLAO|nr:NAD(+) synthase [Flavobacterium enshiense]ESU23299.1 putative NH(3)-dependent NAD+ synthetase NadE [Flavobacterium enshiense DK69]KGO96469.1 NAD synthetase [Flavobacterium enshiense DK69]